MSKAARVEALAAQLHDDVAWQVRRKESIEVLDDRWHRRRVTFDFCVPGDAYAARDDPEFVEVVVGCLEKRPGEMARFDYVGPDGRVLHLPTDSEHVEVGGQLLVHVAEKALGYASGTLVAQARTLSEALMAVAASPYPVALALWQSILARKHDFEHLPDELVSDSAFRWFGDLLARSTLVLAHVPREGPKRRIVKLAYDEESFTPSSARPRLPSARRGFDPYPLELVVPYCAGSSFHVELAAPAGLEVLRVGLSPQVAGQQRESTHRALSNRFEHVYAPLGAEPTELIIEATFRVARQGFVAGAAWVGTAIAGLLAVLLVLLGDVVEHGGTIPSLLLIAPGIASSILGRSADHELTGRLLSTVRRGLIGVVGCVVVAVIALALTTTGPGREPTTLMWVTWSVTTATAIWIASFLHVARRLPAVDDASGFDELARVIVAPIACVLEVDRWIAHLWSRWGAPMSDRMKQQVEGLERSLAEAAQSFGWRGPLMFRVERDGDGWRWVVYSAKGRPVARSAVPFAAEAVAEEAGDRFSAEVKARRVDWDLRPPAADGSLGWWGHGRAGDRLAENVLPLATRSGIKRVLQLIMADLSRPSGGQRR